MQTNGGSTNLINGVSRQPPEVRLTSQLEESLNQFPTVARGLVPRNPTMLRGTIQGMNPTESTTHLIERDEYEQYVVTAAPGEIQVHDLEGTEIPVSYPNGNAYLLGVREGDLEALTVADHTFIVNKRKKVEKDPATSPAKVEEGLIHIVQGDYFNDYKIKIDGNVVAHYRSDGGPHTDESMARKSERGVRTEVIAHMLLHGNAPPGVDSNPSSAISNLRGTLGETDWFFELYDNVILIRNRHRTPFRLEIDASGETRARAHKGETSNFAELPRSAPDGFVIKVTGGHDTGYDDYYVEYKREVGAAQGSWKESIKPGTPYKIDPNTMPHILVREADGTFTFKQAEWGEREVGDEDTNPWPSFVGRSIDGMSFGKNRIGLFSGEAIANSRHGEFFNFFGESIIALLDTDPVDVAISYPEISNILHAVPFSGEIILFTTSVPFRMAGTTEGFSQRTVNMEHLMSNKVSSGARPMAAGNKLFFINDADSGAFVHEFLYDRDVGVKESNCISEHVHGYIPPGVSSLEADDDLKILVLHSKNTPNTLYVYKWLWVGDDKAQSAWQKWEVSDPIIGMKIIGEELVLVTKQANTREVLAINCHEAWRDARITPIFLDRQVPRKGTYNSAEDCTEYTLPYNVIGADVVSVDEENFGVRPEITYQSVDTIKVDGDFSAHDVRIGFPYESYGVLSPLLHRTTDNNGGYGNAVPGMTTTVSSITFGSSGSAFMRVELERAYRKPHVYKLSSAKAGTQTGVHGKLVLGTLDDTLSLLSKTEDMRIKFGNIGPYPYALLSYRWTGSYYPNSY